MLFNVTHGSAEDKERDKKGLSGILEGADEGRRNRTLAAVKENLLLVYVKMTQFSGSRNLTEF